jgi:hypothetical protein
MYTNLRFAVMSEEKYTKKMAAKNKRQTRKSLWTRT